MRLILSILPDLFAICRFEAEAEIPAWAKEGAFISITRTPAELSIVCPQDNIPEGTRCESDWRCLTVEGPLNFALIGILAFLTGTLAEAGVSLFAVSTYDTDYLLVKAEKLSQAINALERAGCEVRP
jgi:hypothetical protein